MKKQKLLSFLKILLWVGFGMSILFFIFMDQEKSMENYLRTVLISMMYTLGYGFSNVLLNDFLDKRYSWTEETRTRAITAVFGTLVVNLLMTYLLNYISFVWLQHVSVDEFFSGKFIFINWFMVNLALLVATFMHARGFMIAMKQNVKQEIIEQKLIAKSANAQFESLKNQLDPHFLFNSLNVLSSLIEENPEQAQDFTASLSKIYRYVLEQKDKELVSVSEELDFAETYTQLLKTRFDESLDVKVQVDEGAKDCFVIPLALQLLLENAIKHNYATTENPLIIRIYSDRQYLVVENNAQPRDMETEREGIGLSNIVQRYALVTKENVFIEKSQEFFRVKIPVLTTKFTVMNTQSPADNAEMIAYQKASKRLKELKGFYGNLISYCLVIPFLIIVNLLTSPKYYWFWWPMLGWGIGVSMHALQTFGMGRAWEERKIKEIMEKQKQR